MLRSFKRDVNYIYSVIDVLFNLREVVESLVLPEVVVSLRSRRGEVLGTLIEFAGHRYEQLK